MVKMKWAVGLVALLACVSPAAADPPEGFLRVDGTRIVDGGGREVILRGMGLGGWMLQEGYMLGIKKDGTQHAIRARIADLIGPADTEAFYRQWRATHMTRADVDRLAAAGFNSIRLPMHYNLFTLPIEDEPVQGQDTWLPTGFEMTDALLAWCRANRMYLILDLHAAPGGQGKDANISDYDPARPSLWESAENRRKTVALWRKLAERYANEPWIGGYDILNEPNWTFEGKDKNGKDDLSNQPIWDLYRDITNAIRSVDPNHLIIVEGNGWGNNYNGFPKPWDTRLVMSFHKYWNPNTEEAIARFLKLREEFQVPIWLGESGENTNEWFRECVALVEKHGIGWAWWPYKKVGNPRCIKTVTAPDDFTAVVAYWNGEGPRPAAEQARRGLFALLENLKSANCRDNDDVARALIPGGRGTPSPAPAPERPRVRLALLGAWHVHTNGFLNRVAQMNAGQVEWMAVWDHDAARGRRFAERLGVPFEPDAQKVLDNPAVDAVMIEAETSRHADLIIRAARAKKHIFTDKILAPTVADALRVKDAVERSGVKFVISHESMPVGSYQYARRLIQQGSLGDVVSVHFRRAHGMAKTNSLPETWWDPAVAGGGALIDLGVHGMGLLTYLAGEPVRVSASMRHRTKRAVEDTATILVDFRNGAIGTAHTNMVTNIQENLLEVVGTDGMLVIVGTEGRETVYLNSRHIPARASGMTVVPPADYTGDGKYPINKFIDFVQDAANPATSLAGSGLDLDTALRVVAISEAGYASARQGGRPVETVALPPAGR